MTSPIGSESSVHERSSLLTAAPMQGLEMRHQNGRSIRMQSCTIYYSYPERKATLHVRQTTKVLGKGEPYSNRHDTSIQSPGL